MDNRKRLSRLLVRQMKERIRELNEQLNSRITITGTKYLLVDRLAEYIEGLERVGAQHTVQLVWSILEREDEEPQQQNSSNASLRTTASSSSVNSPRQDRHGDVMNGSLVNNAYSPVHYELLNRLGDGAPPSSSTFITATASTSPLVNHTPYRRNDRERNTSHASNHSAYGQPIFRTCPFYSGLYLLASMVFTEVSNVKMTETIRFSLKSKDIEKLTGTSYVSKRKTPIISGHRVMIYCVDASQWIATPNAPLPVEFPPVLELSINGTLIRKNLRGIKSRPGTVHPVDITSLCCLKPGATNQLDIVYINSPKRYAFTIWLSQAKEATELVDLLKQRDPFEKIDAQKLLKQITDDSEVMTTCSDVSLRCPLTHIRIRLPCRSRLCKHIQCFDGISFIELNAQTPTWQCPICNRIMTSWEELIWDAYFKQILDSTSTSIDSVIVDDQAEWSIKPNTTQSASVPSTPKSPRSPPKSGEKRKRLLLDIDDDDDNEDTSRDSLSEKKSNIASSTATTSSPSNNGINSKPIPQVIDLTLSSSEDEDDDGDGDDDDGEQTITNTTSTQSVIRNGNANIDQQRQHPSNKGQLASIKTELHLDTASSTNGTTTTSNSDNTISKFIDRYFTGSNSTVSSTTSSVVTPSSPVSSTTTTTTALLRKLNNLDSMFRVAHENGLSTTDPSTILATTTHTTTSTSNDSNGITHSLSVAPMSPASESSVVQWYSPNTSPITEHRTLHTRHDSPLTSHATITTTLLSSTLPTRRNVLDENGDDDDDHDNHSQQQQQRQQHYPIIPSRLSNSSSSNTTTSTTGHASPVWHTPTWHQYDTIHQNTRVGELPELPLPSSSSSSRHSHHEWNHTVMNGVPVSLAMASSSPNTNAQYIEDRDTILQVGRTYPYFVNYGVRATASSSQHDTDVYPHHNHHHNHHHHCGE